MLSLSVDGHDVGVLKKCSSSSFALEAGDIFLGGGDAPGKDFEGYRRLRESWMAS